mgnify:CR=1 FL=1
MYSPLAFQHWTQQFKLGRKDVQNEPWTGRPSEEICRYIIQNEANDDQCYSIRMMVKKTKDLVTDINISIGYLIF